MKKYLLVDTANLFFRARHGAARGADAWAKAGMAIHITLTAANSMVRRFGADHVVFCLEGRSWRKTVYEPYKANRQIARDALTPAEQQEDLLFWETYESFTKYLSEGTNCSVLRCPTAEADDLIARWITLHPDDHHVIVSSDTDFVQLLAPNVEQYNGITDELLTLTGIFDAKGKPVLDKKTKEPKTTPDPQWLLFEKCIRGDSSDNVFSAYPGVRTRGSKTKIGLIEAFEDRDRQGFAWNSLMLSRWMDHEGVEHRVLDDYNRNRTLIDLTAQPDDVKEQIDKSIVEGISNATVTSVGLRLMRFCGKHELVKISESAEQFSKWLNQSYEGVLNAE